MDEGGVRKTATDLEWCAETGVECTKLCDRIDFEWRGGVVDIC